jgi:hypothetical protein
LYEFMQYSRRTKETFLFAARIFSRMLCGVRNGTYASLDDAIDPYRPILGTQALSASERSDMMEESYSLLITAFAQHAEQPIEPHQAKVLSLDFYTALLRSLDANLVPVQFESPLVRFCKQLNTAEIWQQQEAVRRFYQLLPDFLHEAEEATITNTGSTEPRSEGLLPEAALSLHGRRVAWLEQHAGQLFVGFDGVAVLAIGCRVAHSCVPTVQFECEYQPAACSSETQCNCGGKSFAKGGGCTCEGGDAKQGTLGEEQRMSKRQRTEDGEQSGALAMKLLALRDIECGEELTITYIKLTGTVAARREELYGIRPRFVEGTAAAAAADDDDDDDDGGDDAAGGGADSADRDFVCSCARCRHELEHAGRAGVVETESLIHLANQAMESTELDRVVSIYRTILRRMEAEEAEANASQGEGGGARSGAMERIRELRGKAMHGIGVALLGMGRWGEAHDVWKEGADAVPTFALLQEQVAKDEVYYPRDAAALDTAGVYTGACVEGYSAADSSHVGEQVYLSNQSLLTEAECQRVIQLTEAHVGREEGGGWTTSRHYAVPTTDIPLHAVPSLVGWFNAFAKASLFPLLASQFGKPATTFRIHDAFIVKYDARAQRYLPLHCDESEYSFTLALNPTSEYSGGGTYFPSLLQAVRPEQVCAVVLLPPPVSHSFHTPNTNRRATLCPFLEARSSTWVIRSTVASATSSLASCTPWKRAQMDTARTAQH